MSASLPRVCSVRETLTILGLGAAILFAIAGGGLIAYGNEVVAQSNADWAAAGGGTPCNGHSACIAPPAGQPEAVLGRTYIAAGVAVLTASIAASIVLLVNVFRIIRNRSLPRPPF